ncbi:hypothetical protein FKM82_006173 [Ascaphus truei]
MLRSLWTFDLLNQHALECLLPATDLPCHDKTAEYLSLLYWESGFLVAFMHTCVVSIQCALAINIFTFS